MLGDPHHCMVTTLESDFANLKLDATPVANLIAVVIVDKDSFQTAKGSLQPSLTMLASSNLDLSSVNGGMSDLNSVSMVMLIRLPLLRVLGRFCSAFGATVRPDALHNASHGHAAAVADD